METAASAGVTQLVECNLAKVDVAGSNPVSRSKPLKHLERISLAPIYVSGRIQVTPGPTPRGSHGIDTTLFSSDQERRQACSYRRGSRSAYITPGSITSILLRQPSVRIPFIQAQFDDYGIRDARNAGRWS